MIKAVIFDINKVLLDSANLSDRFERDYKISVERFLPALKSILDITYLPNDKPSFTYWQPYFDDWGISLTEQEFWDYWFTAEKIVEPMLNEIKSLKAKGLKIFTLSNNFEERASYYEKFVWLNDLVDKTYFSCRTGVLKPNPLAWEIILKENNLIPEECIYFDDQEKHIRVARNLGVESYLFENAAQAIAILDRLT